MHQGPKRRFFTSAEIWDRWQRGEALKSIGRVFGKTCSVIFACLQPSARVSATRERRRTLGRIPPYCPSRPASILGHSE